MNITAIDPGSSESAMVTIDENGDVKCAEKMPNDEIVRRLQDGFETHIVTVEMVASYGMAVGVEVFETVYWIGRFVEAAKNGNAEAVSRCYRSTVKLCRCKSASANDAAIRQSIIDEYGPTKELAIGTKGDPGPLYGIKADCWQALALALTVLELGVGETDVDFAAQVAARRDRKAAKKAKKAAKAARLVMVSREVVE